MSTTKCCTQVRHRESVRLAKAAALTVAAVLASDSAHADVPLSAADDAQPAYASQDAAAVAAIAASVRLSYTLEYAGAIYRAADGYHYTLPITTGSAGEVAGFRVSLSRGSTAVALYHTHPAPLGLRADLTEQLSPEDIATAKASRLVSYVGVLRSGHVISYDYQHDNARTSRIVGQLH
jgi:Domain of unknown function (DUF4329)